MTKIILLEDMEIYQLSMDIGENIWEIVLEWEYFSRKTLGDQYVKAADSIAANIAEGYGRYFYKDRKLFCYYSRGSLMETKSWTIKAFNRKLLSEEIKNQILEKLNLLHIKLNNYIRSLKQNSS